MKLNLFTTLISAAAVVLFTAGCSLPGDPVFPGGLPIERVSVDASGIQGDNGSSGASISADGRYVAFQSAATNLVAGDTNASIDVFVYDRQTDGIERVSVDASGTEGDDESSSPSISADGRYVAFHSYATNLVAGDTNIRRDVFVYDRVTDGIERVSLDENGNQAGSGGGYPSISADGRHVAFTASGQLVAFDNNGASDIYVYDRQMDGIELVSQDGSGNEGNGASSNQAISADGRYVAFKSDATNLVTGDGNATGDIFVYDRQLDGIERVSVDAIGTEANGASDDPAVSADGRYVVFMSLATNLVTGDANGIQDIFVYDRQTDGIERVSVDAIGTEANGVSYYGSISADGRYVAFDSAASNLVTGDTNASIDVFVYDRQTDGIERVSVDANGTEGDNQSSSPSISADGRYAAFVSYATNLVTGDSNVLIDVFVAPAQ